MSGLIYFFVGMGFLIIASLFSNLQLKAKIKIDNKTNYSFFIIRLFGGLIRLRFNFTLASLERGAISIILRKTNSDLEHHAKIEDIFHYMVNSYKRYIKYADQFRKLVSKTTIQNLNLDMTIGLDDAAQTALLSGSILTLFNSFRGYVKSKFNLKDSKIRLLPYFEGAEFDMVLDCIINVKLGHIIITGIRMLIQSIKGGEISGRTSY